jgi:hypothetical protein
MGDERHGIRQAGGFPVLLSDRICYNCKIDEGGFPMIPSIARQSVIQKCLLQKSVLLGNYEFYYLAGLMQKLYSLDINENMKPDELFSVIESSLETITPSDEKETYLIKMVSVYEPLPEYDDQMRLLFRWGAGESQLWQVQTTYIPPEG